MQSRVPLLSLNEWWWIILHVNYSWYFKSRCMEKREKTREYWTESPYRQVTIWIIWGCQRIGTIPTIDRYTPEWLFIWFIAPLGNAISAQSIFTRLPPLSRSPWSRGDRREIPRVLLAMSMYMTFSWHGGAPLKGCGWSDTRRFYHCLTVVAITKSGNTNFTVNACLKCLKSLFFYGCRGHELTKNPWRSGLLRIWVAAFRGINFFIGLIPLPENCRRIRQYRIISHLESTLSIGCPHSSGG